MYQAFLVVSWQKNLPAMQETCVQSLGWDNPLEKGTATHASILAWRISWTVACQASLSTEISRQEYWSGQPFPSPGDCPNPGIKPRSPVLQADSLPSEPPEKPENTRAGNLSLLQGASQPRNQIRVSCVADGFFTS